MNRISEMDKTSLTKLNGDCCEIPDEHADDKDEKVIIEAEPTKHLFYGIKDTPPIYITVICGLQQVLLSVSNQLVVSLLVAEAVCATNNDVFRSRLLSSTLFMNGVTTVAMTLFGVRLPIFQGAAPGYVVPLLIIGTESSTFCSAEKSAKLDIDSSNKSLNATDGSGDNMELILQNVTMLQGSLMLAGLLHAMLGVTGLIGIFLKFIGPITIVPSLILLSFFIVKPLLIFVEVNWPIALSTAGVAVILALCLAKHNTPVPVWTPSRGFRIIRYPLHQVFAILIAILINWLLCAILTAAGAFTNNPDDLGYKARTDARQDVIRDSPWFGFPYPGQYGAPSFSVAAFVAFLIATTLSVLDSVGDYYACARAARVPVPPPEAVNRGILVEGLCSFLSGAVGCGHATTTYGANIGTIGVTKVASRQVFVCCGILYILFGILSKFSAVFITIPYPVLGGASITLFSFFFGVILSNLQVVSLSSSRNMAIIGIAVILGVMIPTWVNGADNPFDTGNESIDKIMAMILGNPNLSGTVIACVLDNTVPGTKEERGITAWQAPKEDLDTLSLDPSIYDNGYEVYQPLLPRKLLQLSMIRYIPFLPYLDKQKDIKSKK